MINFNVFMGMAVCLVLMAIDNWIESSVKGTRY